MNTRICAGQRRVTGRNGWTITWNQYVPRKADGTRDARCAPRSGRVQVHNHARGHKRLYIDGVLAAERYV